MRKVTLKLSDGTSFEGQSFGYEAPASGEVVFNSAMMGYPETLTDPAYAGQILVLTYPLIGNYGVPDVMAKMPNGLSTYLESDKIHVRALVVSDYSETFSNWNAKESLGEWLKREKIPAITGVDTRELTKTIREKGSMTGKLIFDAEVNNVEEQYTAIDFVSEVSCNEVIEYKAAEYVPLVLDGGEPSPTPVLGKKVVVVDCGLCNNNLRSLLSRGVDVIRVPWDYDFNTLTFDGLFISSGPGNPELCEKTIEHLRKYLENTAQKPLMAIGLGQQLLALALGAKVNKLRYGHHSHNQPVRQIDATRCFITTQNHGYAVDAATLPADWKATFVNMNDGSNEGFRHESAPWFGVQFLPEACGGTPDAELPLYEEFINNMK